MWFRGSILAEIGTCACGWCRAVLIKRPRVLGVLFAVAGLVLVAGVMRPAALHAQGYIDLDVRVSVMNENGGTLEYGVSLLNVQPTSDVTITVSSSDLTVATVDPASIKFTPTNYRIEQVVIVAAVDDDVSNTSVRRSTITFTASGGGYDGISRSHTIALADDEDRHYVLVEGRSYALRGAIIVASGCPVTLRYESSDPNVLTVVPSSLTWNEQDSGTTKRATIKVHDNNDLGDVVVRITTTYDHPPCPPRDTPDFVITVTDNDMGSLTVDAIPACGTTVTDMSVTPSKVLVLTPTPSAKVATEYRVIFDGTGNWLGALPIQPGGRSTRSSFGTFAQLRNAYAGFTGFEYRLRDHQDVTARCTWQFKNPPPTVRLSASPNPVDEGSSVTITARLTEALPADVTIPLTLTAGTAEEDDFGSLSAISINAGSTAGTGTISTNEDIDTDDETFTVALGALPSSVTAGRPNSVVVRITDDDDEVGPPSPPPQSPTVRLFASPNPVDEGSTVTITVRLSETLPADVTIPLTLSAGTAEAGDYGSLPSIAITAGTVTGRGMISTSEDTDTDDETFTVALGALPSSVTAGRPNSVEVTISDNDGGGGVGDPPEPRSPTVSVSASPNPVDEGSTVTITVRLSETLPADVTIPLTLSAGTAEAGDYGSLPSIAITAGTVTGRGMISTSEDTDTDDETFTVALGTLPSSVESGSPSTVEVTIRDNTQVNRPPVFEKPSYTFKLRENEDGRHTPVPLGTVVAIDPDGDEVIYALVSGDVQRFAVGTRSGAMTYTGASEDYETEPNRYGLTLRASDPQGAEATVNVNVEVIDVNEAPSVSAACDPCEVAPGGEVRLSAEMEDPDGDSLACRWNAPTGRFMEGTLAVETRWQAPADTGRVAIIVQVSDGRGGSASAEVAVDVVNAPPAFEKPSYTFELRENKDGRRRPVALGTVTATDPDGDEVTYALASGEGQRFTVGARNGAVTYSGAGEDYETEPNRYGLTMSARDPHGAQAMVKVTIVVTDVNEAPVVSETIPDQALEEGGPAVVLDLEPYFEDPDGDLLSFSSSSSNTAVAVVSVAGSVLMLTPEAYGSVTIEVTAHDPGGLSARQAFAAGVDDRMVSMVLDETLAALARAHLASARMTLGRRVGPDGVEGRSRLMVLGISIPLDKQMAREAAGRLLVDPRSIGSLGAGARRTEFMFGWGSGNSTATAVTGRRTWRLWGQGDIQTFSSAPATERGFEGDLRSGWIGLDRALGNHWLTGVAVAMSNSGSDWHAGTTAGRLWTSMTAVYPYLRWADGGSSIWAMGGGGLGSAENVRATGREGESILTLGLGVLEVRRRIAGWFGLRADAGYARLETVQGAETVDGRSAVVDQQRMGIELSPSSRHVGVGFDASVRRDGGDGQTGTGFELAGGIRAAGGPVRIDALGRILVLHSAQGYKERGLGVTLTIGSPPDEGGLMFLVTSSWGGPAAETGTLWQTRVYGLQPNAPAAPWSVGARIRWVLAPPEIVCFSSPRY